MFCVFAEIWKQDVGDLFQIAPSTQGIQNVHLKCGSNSMFVKLETDNEFTGVMYAKGSFYDQADSPCFVQSKKNRGIRNLSMRFTFDQCNTKHEGNVFTNTIIVQNDPELVTPGDAAFALQCDFRKPRGLNVEANYETSNDRYILLLLFALCSFFSLSINCMCAPRCLIRRWLIHRNTSLFFLSPILNLYFFFQVTKSKFFFIQNQN